MDSTDIIHNEGRNPNWFNGKCNYCGQQGHRERECPHKPPNQTYRGRTNNGMRERHPCAICGDLTHMTERCWEDPRNASIRPNNWKSKLRNGPITDINQISEITNNFSDQSRPQLALSHCEDGGSSQTLQGPSVLRLATVVLSIVSVLTLVRHAFRINWMI